MKTLLASIFALFAMGAAQAADAAPASTAMQGKVAMCIGCHGIVGYRSSFPELHKVPMISGQTAAYITSALTAYKTGDRKHPTMDSVAANFSEADIAEIADYYANNGSKKVAPAQVKPPSPQVAALINRIDGKSCVSCHGANFSTPNDGTVPKIAGQHPDYLYVALKGYQQPVSKVVGRSNAVMGGIAKKYFTHQELKALADYIGSLPSELETVPQSRFR